MFFLQLFLLLLSFTLNIITAYGSGSSSNHHAINNLPPKHINKDLDKTYGVIIDCGSSGSRVHIFQWHSWLRYPELLNNIEPLRDEKGEPLTKKIHPGLSSLMYNPEQAFEYLKPIIKFVEDKVPKNSYKATSIYVLATAGMRLLDSETQLEIMNDLVEDFESEDSFASFKTKVISGASEGMYQWITVNSKAKRFKDNNPKKTTIETTNTGDMKALTSVAENNSDTNDDQKTLGLIEMGGASIQVTYQLNDKIKSSIGKKLKTKSAQLFKAFRDQIIEPKISREAEEFNYKLVSTTFLGFGSNSARLTFVDLLVNRYVNESKLYEKKKQIFKFYTKQTTLTLPDPCLPVGSSESVTRPARILTVPENAPQTVGFNIEEDDVTISVRLEGTGNYEQCYSSLEEMLKRSKKEKLNCKESDEGCTMSLIGEEFVPFEEYEFLGLSDFYYTTNEMINLAGKYKKAAIVEKTKEICKTPYKKLLILYPDANKHDKSRVMRECFKAIWVDIFLSQALNMPNDYENLTTVGKINGDEIDWTLGAVLDNSLSMEMAAEAPELYSI